MADNLRIAITGASGLIGRHLTERFRTAGHRVHPMVRRRDEATGDAVYWNVDSGQVDAHALDGVDAVVHLAGEPLGKRRWTPEVKREIYDSRALGTQLLSQALASLDRPPAVLVSSSAVGYYGDRGDDPLPESEPAGTDFLAEVCVAWEEGTKPAEDAGIRVVHFRQGVSIAHEGPLIEKVELPFKLGVGGKVASGDQWLPWISLEDTLRAQEFLLERDDLSGPFNIVSPGVCTNVEFAKAFGEVLHRPAVFPIPAFVLKILYGEMGTTLGLQSQKVIPQALLDAGFEFRHTDIRSALRAIYG